MGEDDPVEMLLVDDDASDVELMLRAFKENDLAGRVHAVADGGEALDYIFCTGAYADRDIKNLPKVILLDLNLPKVNGKEVLRRIKSDERTKAIPVVIMSSSQQETDVTECYKLGASSYVVKEVGFKKLTEAVKQLKQH